MYQGTTIEELIEIVARAEEHARQLQVREALVAEELCSPGFFCELPQAQPAMFGVA